MGFCLAIGKGKGSEAALDGAKREQRGSKGPQQREHVRSQYHRRCVVGAVQGYSIKIDFLGRVPR